MDDQAVDLGRPNQAAPRPTGNPRQSPVRLKRRLGSMIGVLLVAGALAGGTMYWLDTRDYVTTDDAFIDAYTTQVAPRVSGQVTKLLFTDNQHVTAGQTLVLIDPRDIQARLDQALAQQASAEASLQQAKAQVFVQQANVDQAKANVLVAQSELAQARADYTRFTGIDPKAVTRQQVDSATATFHSADAKLEASRQTVTGAQAQVQAAQAQVLAAEAQVKQATANAESAKLQLSYATIVAPVTGTVTHRTVEAGNFVNPGQALFALVQDDRWVTANFKETQLDAIRPGQPVELSIDAVPSMTFRGKVDSLQAGTGSVFSTLPAENATGNFVKIVQRLPVKIVFDDDRIKDHPLAPGMSVVPSIKVR